MSTHEFAFGVAVVVVAILAAAALETFLLPSLKTGGSTGTGF